ncbi:MAG: hypothetical protein ACYTEQ_13905 [Planctomycetota bacterium]|jgi:hypothetical protein
MDMYDSLFSPDSVLSEQIATQLFEVLPEGGPLIAIMDGDGGLWCSDSEKLSRLNIEEWFLRELRARIDDGVEPVVTQTGDCSIVGAQLYTGRAHCGYVIIALSQYSPESTLINIDLIETLLSQVGLIGKLVEKIRQLHELQAKHFNTYGQSELVSN